MHVYLFTLGILLRISRRCVVVSSRTASIWQDTLPGWLMLTVSLAQWRKTCTSRLVILIGFYVLQSFDVLALQRLSWILMHIFFRFPVEVPSPRWQEFGVQGEAGSDWFRCGDKVRGLSNFQGFTNFGQSLFCWTLYLAVDFYELRLYDCWYNARTLTQKESLNFCQPNFGYTTKQILWT